MSKVIRELEERERKAREVRRKMANWEFIDRQEPKVKAALKFLVETGDLRTASKLAGMNIDELASIAKRANIPSGP